MIGIHEDAPMTAGEFDRRMEERREDDKHRQRTIIALAALLVTVGAILVSVTASWITSTNAMAQKVDRIEQIKTDAGFDARINVNTMRIDGIQQSLQHLQISVDSVNLRLTQVLCDGQHASCR